MMITTYSFITLQLIIVTVTHTFDLLFLLRWIMKTTIRQRWLRENKSFMPYIIRQLLYRSGMLGQLLASMCDY